MNKMLLIAIGALLISTMKLQARLYIPRLDQSIAVYETIQIGRTWDISHVGDQAGQLSLDQTSNVVIAGHRTVDNQPGAFYRLDQLSVGDFIYYTVDNKTYLYQVVETKIVDDHDMSIVEATENQQLTLFTCTVEGYPVMRYVVVAVYRGQTFCAEQGKLPTTDCE
jgi:sortase A